MNEPSWDELQKLWVSPPPGAELVADELQRKQKGRKWLIASAAVESAIAIAGLAAGIWLIARGDQSGVLAAAATIVFTVTVSAMAIWARAIRRPRLEGAIANVVAEAVESARIGVRVAAATIFGVCAGMGFTAFISLMRGLMMPEETSASGHIAVGVTQLLLMVWLLLAFLYYRKRSADLTRLEAIAASITDG